MLSREDPVARAATTKQAKVYDAAIKVQNVNLLRMKTTVKVQRFDGFPGRKITSPRAKKKSGGLQPSKPVNPR